MNWSPRSTKAMPPERPRNSRSSTRRPRKAIASSRSPTWTATWLIPTSRAMRRTLAPARHAALLRGRLGPHAGELDDGRRRRRHVLHARPLAHRVVLLTAREEVRRREAASRELRAVRPAPRDRHARLDARAADRLERGLDNAGVLLDERPHVAVRMLDLDLDLRARLAYLHLTRERLQELEMLREQLVVVVARDEVDDRLLSAAGDAVRVDVALAALCRLRREPSLRK